MSRILVNETHLVVHGITGDAGDANGLGKLTCTVSVPTLAVAFSLKPEDVAGALGISGVKCVSRPFHQDADDEFLVSFNFEGCTAEVSPAQADEKATYDFDTSMNEAAIQTHPQFAMIKQLYGWDAANERFPELLPDGKTKSHLFGDDGWLVIGGEFKKNFVATSAPTGLMRGIGQIVAVPPGWAELGIEIPRGRNFLKLAPKLTTRGNALQLVETHLLSGPRGFNKHVYNFGQFQ